MAVRLMSPTVLLLANGICMMTRYSILNMKFKKNLLQVVLYGNVLIKHVLTFKRRKKCDLFIIEV